ncbi:hypothetical protein MKK75_29965 [Methylobacterium sp. J-030]|nr:hypothetical protein [Methylobacterium sp. J-030]
MNRNPIFFVGLVYYPNYLDYFIARIEYLHKLFKFDAVRIVLNNPTIARAELERLCDRKWPNFAVLIHDNVGQEFGGYQRGVDNFLSVSSTFDLVVANDTLDIHHRTYTAGLRSFCHTFCGAEEPNIFVGKIDHYRRVLRIDGLATARWVRSNFFALDSEALEAIKFKIYDESVNTLIFDTVIEDEFFSEAIGPELRNYLRNWLFVPTNDSWYKAAPLDVTNSRALAVKARAILQEKYLSMRLSEAGTAFISSDPSGMEKVVVLLRRRLEAMAVRARTKVQLSGHRRASSGDHS